MDGEERQPTNSAPWQMTVAVVLLLLLLAVSIYQSATAPTPPSKYEYKIETIPDASFANTMNLLGYQGWEAVSARRASDGASTNPTFSYEIIFRRVKRDGGIIAPLPSP